MEKEFVPYEIALDLKQLGFNESCFAYCNSFYKKDIIKQGVKGCVNSALEINEVALPLYQQVFKWFRNKHNLIGYIQTSYITREIINNISIPCSPRIEFTLGITSTVGACVLSSHNQNNFKTHEEAELECLKKLIEIVK
jgi:hypothetical protein